MAGVQAYWIVKMDSNTRLPQESLMSENLNLTDQLAQLHEAYVVAVNEAVAADDMIVVDELARDFDRESMELITHHQAPAA
jgi:hypothetical protein